MARHQSLTQDQQQPIKNISKELKDRIKQAVIFAKQVYPNAHLGEESPREDIASAVRYIRRVNVDRGLDNAVSALEVDLHRYENM